MKTPPDLEIRGDPPYFVHPSAIVDEPAHIGENTRIYHFCHISSGAHLGKRCVLGQNVFIAPTAILGNDVRVQNNVSIYDGVVIEDFVFLQNPLDDTFVEARASHQTININNQLLEKIHEFGKFEIYLN